MLGITVLSWTCPLIGSAVGIHALLPYLSGCCWRKWRREVCAPDEMEDRAMVREGAAQASKWGGGCTEGECVASAMLC